MTVKLNKLERAISRISPSWGSSRLAEKMRLDALGGYTGASNKNVFKGWTTASGDGDTDILPDLPILRRRSSDLARNNPLGCSAINTTVTNVVGSGLIPNPTIDYEFLGMSEDEADAWESNTKREFLLWAESTECDANGTSNFFDHENLCFRSVLERGDVAYTLPLIKRNNFPYRTKLLAIEADRLSNPGGKRDTAETSGGITVDSNGCPKTYHFSKKSAGKAGLPSYKKEWEHIPAFGAKTGRRNVIHPFVKRRPGQRRGVPFLAPVIESLKQLGRYTEAELMAAVVSGMFTVFIKRANGGQLDLSGMNSDSSTDGLKLGNGAIVGLGDNEDITTANPGRPNGQFDPFTLSIIKQIGAALEIPFELLVKHFTASYSASRAAIQEAWRFFLDRRVWLVRHFCMPVYEAWMYEAVLIGRISAPGFLEDPLTRKAYLAADWIGPPKGNIDPLKENKADEIAEDRGWKTEEQNAAERGNNLERNLKQKAKVVRLKTSLGLNNKPDNSDRSLPEPDQEDEQDDENS